MSIPPAFVMSDNYVCESFFRDFLGLDMAHYFADDTRIDLAIQEHLPHLIDVPTPKLSPQVLDWIKGNVTGPWFLNYSRKPAMISVFFLNYDDAVAFTLIM